MDSYETPYIIPIYTPIMVLIFTPPLPIKHQKVWPRHKSYHVPKAPFTRKRSRSNGSMVTYLDVEDVVFSVTVRVHNKRVAEILALVIRNSSTGYLHSASRIQDFQRQSSRLEGEGFWGASLGLTLFGLWGMEFEVAGLGPGCLWHANSP